MKTETEVHPVDTLAAALNRASVLLAALVDLYDADRESFVGGNAFIVHGVSTAHELLEEAGRALADLHESARRTLLEKGSGDSDARAPTAAPAVARPTMPPTIAAAVTTLEEGGQTDAEAAQTYRDLLGKIAKVEAHGALAPATAELLPMLQALRTEIQKAGGTA